MRDLEYGGAKIAVNLAPTPGRPAGRLIDLGEEVVTVFLDLRFRPTGDGKAD